MENINVLLLTQSLDFAEDIERRFKLEEPRLSMTVENSGATGYNYITAHPVDYLFIDMNVIDVDLYQLLSSVSQYFNHIKRIVIMEQNDPLISAQLITNGANYTLAKPISGDRLIELIGQMEVSSKFPTFGMDHTVGSPFEQPAQAPRQMPQQPQVAPVQPGMPGGFPPPQQGQYFQPHQPQFQGGQLNSFPPPQQNNYFGGGIPQQSFPAPAPAPVDEGFRYRNGAPQGGVAQSQAPQGSGSIRTLKQATIAINCSKGGVGKTTLSKELALAYSSVRINGEPLKVVLVDCDIQFGDIASVFGVKPYPNIRQWHDDIVAMKKKGHSSDQIRFSQDVIESKYLINYEATGLKILAAPPNTSEAMNFMHQEMKTIVSNLKACNYDVIMLDTGNNIDDYTIICLEEATMILIVTTVEIAAIDDTIKLVKLLRQSNFSLGKAKLLINKVPPQSDIEIEQISEAIGLDIIAMIPDYPKLRVINNQGNAAVLSKDTEFSIAIRKLAHEMVPVFNKQVNKGNDKKSAGGEPKKKGFMSALFGKKER